MGARGRDHEDHAARVRCSAAAGLHPDAQASADARRERVPSTLPLTPIVPVTRRARRLGRARADDVARRPHDLVLFGPGAGT